MYDVITIGTATQDVFLKSRDFKIIKSAKFKSGEAECFSLGSKIEVPEIFFATGGGATNAAVTFARQGFKTAAVTKVGSDAAGEAVTADLLQNGVDAKFVRKIKNEATAYSVILIAPTGERTILVHRGVSEHLQKSDLPEPAQFKAKWLYLAPLGGGNVKLFAPILKMAEKNKIKTAVNPSRAQLELGLKKLRPMLKRIQVFVLNQEEAAFLTGLPFKEEKLIFKALDKVIDGIAVMTKGPKGVVVSDGKTLWRAGIYPEKKVADRTGAGDAFGSGFVAGMMRSGDIEYAVRAGSANATSKVEHPGAKAGLLYKKDLHLKRWRRLTIKKESL